MKTSNTGHDRDAARAFVKSIEIAPPEVTDDLESAVSFSRGGDPESLLPTYEDSDQAVTIGSQIAEFAANVPAGLRPHISNSFLLAQLAAQKQAEQSGSDTGAWFEKYVDVLGKIGWLLEGDAVAGREVSGDALDVHKEIIAVVALALGPAAAGASIVISALKGLSNMSEDSPWITLFDRQCQRASVNQFQIGYAHMPNGTSPEIVLACFELSAAATVTQVLFFKFSSSEAKLKHSQAKLSMNPSVFESTQELVQDKIAAHINSNIRSIEI